MGLEPIIARPGQRFYQLNYFHRRWWEEVDLNHRTQWEQIYSLPRLTTSLPSQRRREMRISPHHLSRSIFLRLALYRLKRLGIYGAR